MARGRDTSVQLDPPESISPPARTRTPHPPTVLLVEDEDAVRRVAGEVLQTAGYKVLEAKNGREALRLLERLHTTVEVLVADVVMPEMNGPDLARELALRNGPLRTIFISGYAEPPLLRGSRALYLHKPFSVEALTGIVAQALANK